MIAEKEAIAFARRLANVDLSLVALECRAELRTRGRREEWLITTTGKGTGPAAAWVIARDSGVLLSKTYVGFGRPTSELAMTPRSANCTVLEREQWLDSCATRTFAALCEAEVRRFQVPLRGFRRALELKVTEIPAALRLEAQQVSGPFSVFRHVLVCVDLDGGTLVRERVEYRLSWDVVGDLLDAIFGIGRTLAAVLEVPHAASPVPKADPVQR